MRAASAQWQRRARGAHGLTYDRPLQLLVMCACHRTAPTATLLACEGLYSATAVEQRGRNLPKLLAFKTCHCSSGATPPMSYMLARSIYWPLMLATQDRTAVRAIGVGAAETKTPRALRR
jgi:hypothetical protein